MTHLGDFGQTREPVVSTFGWFGAAVRVHPDLSDLALIELFASMSSPEDGAAAVEALRGMAAALVHPDDLSEFWALAKENRQTMEDIAGLAMQLIGALAERPTQRPSASSDGPRSTAARSTGDSSSVAFRRYDGRPDLQVAVLRAKTA